MTTFNRLPAALTAGFLGVALVVAPAAAEEGLYLHGLAGMSLPEDSSLDTSTAAADAELEKSWTAGVGAGYAYGNGFRTEFELGYHTNEVDNVGGAAGGGDMKAYGLMFNGYYDFFRDSRFQPYIGAGVGAARVDASDISPVAGSSVDDDDLGFAWQGMAGVAYAVNEAVRITLGYRYFNVPDVSFTTAGGAAVDSDYTSHDLLLGVRFTFGTQKPPMPASAAPAQAAPLAPSPAPEPALEAAPRAAPAPAPTPAPPINRNFIVFFDWNSATLSRQARGIIDSAASEAKRAGPVRLRLTGHSDRSGPTRYNERLSMRRATAVRGALESRGIPGSDIAVFARGEAEPLLSTADGVREPQNRRVEIVLE